MKSQVAQGHGVKHRSTLGRALSFALLLALFSATGSTETRPSLDIRNATVRIPASDTDINAAKETLLAQVSRPTIQDVLDAFGGSLPPQNPFQPIGADARIDKLMSLGPEMIAQFEFAFPGAIWAPLGRDAGAVGDILEAYYESKGIHGRVVRLNASTASFKAPGFELKFLYSAGLIPSPEAEAERKFVIVDPTSWSVDSDGNPISQIRKIISAYYQKHGGFRTLGFVNAIGLGTSSRGALRGQLIAPSISVDTFWAGMTFKPAEPTQIFYSYPDFTYLKLAPDSQDEISWHDSFLALVGTPSGGVVAPPGPPSSPAMREHILWMSYEIIKAVRTPEFQRSVSEQAMRHGFNIDRVLETDFARLENDRRFQAFAGQRRWQYDDIKKWKKSTFNGLPKSTSTLAKLRLLELTVIGVAQGNITAAVLEKTLKAAVVESAKNPVLADFIANLILSESHMKGRSTLLAALESPTVRAESAGLDAIFNSSAARANIDKLPKSLAEDHGRLIRALLVGIGNIKTIDGLIARMREILAYAKTPADYLRILQYHLPNSSYEYKVHLQKFVLGQLDAFIAAGATIADLKQLESQAVWDIKERLDVMRRGLDMVKTPADYLALTKFSIYNPSDAYKQEMSSFIAQTIGRFITLPGMTVSTLKDIEAHIVDADHHIRVLQHGLALVKSAEDFRKLTEPTADSQLRMGAFVAENIGVAINNGATIADLKAIEKQSCYYVRDAMEVTKKGMALVRSHEDFRLLTQFAFPNPRDEYKKEMAHFIHMNPDYANHNVTSIAQLQQRLGEMADSTAILTNLLWGLKFVHSVEDLIELMRPPEALDQRFQSAYELFLLADGGDKLMKLNPSVAHVDAVLRMFRNSPRAPLIATRLLPNASSPEVYISIMKFALSIQSSDVSNTKRLILLAKENLVVFMGLHPSAENIAELRQILRSRLKYDLHIPSGPAATDSTDATLRKMSLWDRAKTTIARKFQREKSCKASLLPKSGD